MFLPKTHLFLVSWLSGYLSRAPRRCNMLLLPSLTLSINGFSFENSFFSKKFFTFQIDQEPGEFLLFLCHLVCYTVSIVCHCRYSRGVYSRESVVIKNEVIYLAACKRKGQIRGHPELVARRVFRIYFLAFFSLLFSRSF